MTSKPSLVQMESWLERFTKDLEAGADLRDQGKCAAAKARFASAAEALALLASGTGEGKLREQRLEFVDRLLDEAERLPDSDKAPKARAKGNGKAKPIPSGGDDDDEEHFEAVKDLDRLPGFDDVIGLEEAKKQVSLRMIDPFLNPEAARRHNLKKGGGILLFAPPGTGKTMFAKAVAKELGAAFYSILCSQIISKWVGVAEQNIERLFHQARSHERSVIFMDEIESLTPRRDSKHSSVMQRAVTQLLTEMDGFSVQQSDAAVLVIGATNKPWSIDSAFLRPGRFDLRIFVDLPGLEARRAILRSRLAQYEMAVGLDVEPLAERTAGYSGADLGLLVERIGQLGYEKEVTTKEAAPYDKELLEKSLNDVRPSVDQDEYARLLKWCIDNYGLGKP